MLSLYTNHVDYVNMIPVHTLCDNVPMEEMGSRLRKARVKAGFKSARSAAVRFGWAVSTYGAHENGQNEFGPEAASEYASAFKTTPGWLLTGQGIESFPFDLPPLEERGTAARRIEAEARSENPPPANPIPPPYHAESNVVMEGPARERWEPRVRDVEELGLGLASIDGDESAFEFNGQVIDRVVRPPGLIDRKGVFALRVANLSMWPKFRDGERIYVDSKRPAIEDFVVIELKPTEEGRPGKAYVKMLIGRDARKVRVQQFNPEGFLEFAHDEILRTFRVIPTEELWGG